MRTANPALRDDVFVRARALSAARTGTMTVKGAVNRTAVLLLLLVGAAFWSWQQSLQQLDPSMPARFFSNYLVWVGLLGGFIIGMVTTFKKSWAPLTAPIYAVFEGLFLGATSAAFELAFPGIVFQAMLGTFGTLFALLAVYRLGLVRATENFRLGILAATGGILLIYVVTLILGLVNVHVPYIHESGPIGIGFSVLVVIVAALNLVLDFDFIESGERRGAPKYMEWYAAFGLMVTLVWLYLEILRLLAKSRRR